MDGKRVTQAQLNPKSDHMNADNGNMRSMQKISEIVCWIAVGILLLYGILVVVVRGFGVTIALLHLFVDSSLPWWILAPSAVVLAMGFAYLLRNVRLKRNQ
jgi:hypothetical protein